MTLYAAVALAALELLDTDLLSAAMAEDLCLYRSARNERRSDCYRSTINDHEDLIEGQHLTWLRVLERNLKLKAFFSLFLEAADFDDGVHAKFGRLPGECRENPKPRQAGIDTGNAILRPMATPKTETAMFGAGCFWGVEETFLQTPGVLSTAVGYAGGHTESPTYEQVCTDSTGHAEVVKVEFDPAVLPYPKLLEIFWENHNPTTMNRQGPDTGSQYRSVIFTYSAEQKKFAEESKDALGASGKWKNPIVTQIEDAPEFTKAEEYHQQYLRKRGLSSCHF